MHNREKNNHKYLLLLVVITVFDIFEHISNYDQSYHHFLLFKTIYRLPFSKLYIIYIFDHNYQQNKRKHFPREKS